MLKLLIAISLCIPAFAMHPNTKDEGNSYAQEQELSDLNDILIKTDRALDSMIRVAVVNMRDAGHSTEADQLEAEWNQQFKGSLLQSTRDIGHVYLIGWLERSYDVIELALGVEVCKALHLSDIKTVNCALVPLFNPCSYDMTGVTETREQDYVDHMAHGAVYYGLIPVTVWWGITIECWTETAGLGSFLCSIAASAAEWFTSDVIAPGLAKDLFELQCE